MRRDPDSFAAQARQLKAEDVELSVSGYELRGNGQSLYKTGGGCSGRFIWVDVPQIGRFVFSIVPKLEAEGFERAAYVSNQQLVLTPAKATTANLSKNVTGSVTNFVASM